MFSKEFIIENVAKTFVKNLNKECGDLTNHTIYVYDDSLLFRQRRIGWYIMSDKLDDKYFSIDFQRKQCVEGEWDRDLCESYAKEQAIKIQELARYLISTNSYQNIEVNPLFEDVR